MRPEGKLPPLATAERKPRLGAAEQAQERGRRTRSRATEEQGVERGDRAENHRMSKYQMTPAGLLRPAGQTLHRPKIVHAEGGELRARPAEDTSQARGWKDRAGRGLRAGPAEMPGVDRPGWKPRAVQQSAAHRSPPQGRIEKYRVRARLRLQHAIRGDTWQPSLRPKYHRDCDRGPHAIPRMAVPPKGAWRGHRVSSEKRYLYKTEQVC